MPSSDELHRAWGWRLTLLAATLTFGTGALDVASFTRLGQVFSSVMTGNLVLLGLAAATQSVSLAVHTALAFAGYLVGVAAGTRVAGRPDAIHSPVWPRSVTVTLYVEWLLLAGFTLGWELAGARPTGTAQLGLLVVVSCAMGLQAAAVRGLGGGLSVSTTYLTGTLTAAVATLVGSQPGRRLDTRSLAILAAAAVGAAGGGAVVAITPAALPALPLAALTGAVIARGLIARE